MTTLLNKGRGYFQPCATCDRPELCETVRPHTQPCWYARVPIGLLEEARDRLRATGRISAGGDGRNHVVALELDRYVKESG